MTATKGKNKKTSRAFTTRAGKAIKDRPATSAAIATGLISGVAAGIAGFIAFKKSGKTFGEFSDDLAATAKTRIKDGIADAKARAKDWSEPRKDGFDETRSQREIAEEALTTKAVGRKTKRPTDPTIEEALKTGAAAL